MEVLPAIKLQNENSEIDREKILQSSDRSFIQANTLTTTMEELRNRHVIPVFIKDNEPVISHADFIESAYEVVKDIFNRESIASPAIRISHPIKGRIPEARNKPANQLLEHEKTIYYERMAFAIEIPSICSEVAGNTLSLTIGGVKAYNLDNLYGKKGSDEHFKVFIGFKNSVCTNLCIWSDGFSGTIKVSRIEQLQAVLKSLLVSFQPDEQINALQGFSLLTLSEQQFAKLIGRCKMYPFLTSRLRETIPHLSFGDNQISNVCRDYFQDPNFQRYQNGEICLWRLYNLFTGANKRSYIDQFLERSVNAFQFVSGLKQSMDGKSENWFLH